MGWFEGNANEDDEEFHLQLAVAESMENTMGNSRCLPFQVWEIDKLEAAAQQVVAALEAGRYEQAFGEALLNHLQPWAHADAWARNEYLRVSALVDANDDVAKREFAKWIESSLVSILREAKKAMHTAALSGVARRGAGYDASSYTASAPEDSTSEVVVDTSCGQMEASTRHQSDIVEEAQFQLSLLESLADGAFEDSDADEEDADDVSAQAEDDVHRVYTLESGGTNFAETTRECCSSSNAASCCMSQRCMMNGPFCCHCLRRVPCRGTLDSLMMWALSRRHPCDVLESQCRFYCEGCASSRACEGSQFEDPIKPPCLKLPFGGTIIAENPGDIIVDSKFEKIALTADNLASLNVSMALDAEVKDDSSWVMAEASPRSSTNKSQTTTPSWVVIAA